MIIMYEQDGAAMRSPFQSLLAEIFLEKLEEVIIPALHSSLHSSWR